MEFRFFAGFQENWKTCKRCSNPCPCGFLGDSQHDCTCTGTMLHRYRNRLSGPLLDRIDLHVEVPRVPHKELTTQCTGESSSAIRQRVNKARQIQYARLAKLGIHANSQMQARHIRKFCKLNHDGDRLLEQVTDKLGLSARSFTRILKLARTIADLSGSEHISTMHLSEAIQYRGQERNN